MKIDRRCFIGMGIGAAAGIAFSPLPWKLTDDVSIWTQNWPWTPVPERGEVRFENSVCTLCPGGCGITVRKVGERVVKIEGTPAHPVNKGGICALGVSGTQFLYGPDRIKSPMKRTGNRGEGKWTPISWNDAIAEVTNKLNDLTKSGKTEGLACITDTDRGTVPLLLKRLLSAIGSPNFMTSPTLSDSQSVLLKKLHGVSSPTDLGYDIENADFVLSFGCGVIEGWGSPVRMIKAKSGFKARKARLIQTEQRLSNTASSADNVIALKPGTEADLALGMAAVIIELGLYNKASVGGSKGFDEFAGLLKQKYSVQAVSETTGVKTQIITEIAKQFADSGTASLAICGKGKGQTTSSMKELMAVHILNVLGGRINVKGGVFAFESDYISWANDSKTNAASSKARADKAGSGSYPDTASLLNRLPDEIAKKGSSPVELLLVSQANPVYTLTGTKQVVEAFKKIPYIVSFSTYMDDTTSMADIVLPHHSYLERYQDVPVIAGLIKPMIGLTRPVIKPVYDTQHTGDVVIKIAKAMGGSVAEAFTWNDYQDCLEKTLGNKWDEMKKNSFWSSESSSPRSLKGLTFPAVLPEFPVLPGDATNFPLILLPKESMRISSNETGDSMFALKTVPAEELTGNLTVVEINPVTGKSMGLSDRKEAVLTTPSGSAKVMVWFNDGIMAGVVAMSKGLGHTAYGKYLKNRGTNYNELAAPVEDPASGQDAAWGSRAKIGLS